MALREIFDVSGRANIIAKEQGKTNLKHGAYLHQPMAYSAHPGSGSGGLNQQSFKSTLPLKSFCNSTTETGTSSKGPLHKEDTLSQLDQSILYHLNSSVTSTT